MWERLNHRRASRIAAYRKGAIDEPETLGDIKMSAVDRLLKLKKVFAPRIADVQRKSGWVVVHEHVSVPLGGS